MGNSYLGRTEEEEFDLAFCPSSVIANLLINLLVTELLRVCAFPAKAHDARSHLQPRYVCMGCLC